MAAGTATSHGRRDRNAASALDLEPVGHGARASALAVHGADAVDRVRVEGEHLGQGRLASVGARDNGDDTPTPGLLGNVVSLSTGALIGVTAEAGARL